MQRATEFSTLCVFYMIAFLLDLTEEWDYPVAGLLFLGLVLVLVLRRVGRLGFLLFLVLSSAYTLTAEFPDIGNHNNLFLLCNFSLIAGILYSLLRPQAVPDDEALVRILKPPLRVALSVVYFFAGFHKLNWDFLDPAVTCASGFVHSTVAMLHVPDVPLLGLAYWVAPALILAWELGGGVLLWFRRLQAPVLLVSWVTHSILAMMVFFDFSSMAFALMLTYLPGSHWERIHGTRVHLGPVWVQRTDFYLGLNALAIVAAGIYFRLQGFDPWFHWWQGMALNVAFLVFLWPALRGSLPGGDRLRWIGVPVWDGGLPRGWVVFPAVMILFAVQPYLGLRTGGTFSMFSNLRTEGESSNHVLLGLNPLKVWDYQEDVVEIVDLDPRHATKPRHSLIGLLLPVVEFKKRIYEWRRDGVEGMRAVFRYRDELYETEDVVRENPWDVRGRDLEMYLLDFRPIQKSRPNRCRW